MRWAQRFFGSCTATARVGVFNHDGLVADILDLEIVSNGGALFDLTEIVFSGVYLDYIVRRLLSALTGIVPVFQTSVAGVLASTLTFAGTLALVFASV